MIQWIWGTFFLLFASFWWPNIDDYLSRRNDRLDLYERNRDIPNWDVRENWQYQKRAYLEGNTRIRSNNFRRRRSRSEYEPPRSNRGYYRPRY